jgi:hypothetical protein
MTKDREKVEMPKSGHSTLPLSPFHFAVVLLIVAAGAAFGLTPTWQWEGFLTYDDNPFRYSRTDLDAFRHREEPARFPIRTSDDLDANVAVGLSCGTRLFRLPGAIETGLRLHGCFSNWEKSYGVADVGLNQGTWAGGRLELGYTYMPNYLIRYYRNPETGDTGDYTGCRFAEHLATVQFRQQFDPLTIRPEYGYEYDDYQSVFDHYDTKIHRLGGEVRFKPVTNLEVRGEYEYRRASARGPVASYAQHEAGLSVMTRPRRLSRFSFEGGYTFARRDYTTGNSSEIDPSHAGRVDNIEAATVTVKYRLADVTLTADYDLEWREVVSAYSAEIDDVKDYRQSRFGLGVAFSSRKTRVTK